MNFTKKLFSVIIAGLLAISFFTSCTQSASSSDLSSVTKEESSANTIENSNNPAEKTTMNITALKGPTGLGMLSLMEQNEAQKTVNQYKINLASDPNSIVAQITTGEIDIAAVPTNLAATLYNKTNGKVQLAALNTLGVLYVLSNGETIESVKDLKGKTLFASGQGAIPEYALNYILEKNDLELNQDVTVEYKTEHAELAALAVSGKAKIVMLPEPFVTQVLTKNKDMKLALNITNEWEKAVDSKSVLSMGCIIVRKDFADKNKEAFNQFLKEYQASAEFANSNVDKTAELSERYDIMPVAVAKKAIPNCNIVYIDGEEMRNKVEDFLDVLFQANPKSVGGKMPGEDFYYKQ